MKRLGMLIIVGLLLAAATAAWAGEKGKTQPFPLDNCPMMVKRAFFSYQNIDGGAALVFKTEDGDAKDLQARVAQMASMYNNHKECGFTGNGPMMMRHEAATGQGMGGMGGDKDGSVKGRGMMGQGAGVMMRADARVEDTGHGARLIITPVDKENLDALRKQVKWMARHMSQGKCPDTAMMGDSVMGEPSKSGN